ncbi:MAG: hypothetical protein ACP5RH_22560, partial [Leptodesmis sp.]
IGSEVKTDYGGFIDLLCINSKGDLVVVELKRDLTPREVVAQALDYASWVEGLSNSRITEIANQYLQTKYNLTLEIAFAKAFNSDLPSTLNTDHSMIIVASQIDNSSERIINYLSRTHGVSINAMTFQYFRHERDEMLGRVFLIEPSLVEQSTQEKSISKRKPNLSYEAIQDLADQHGEVVSTIYRTLVQGLVPKYFSRTSTTQSSIVFNGSYNQSPNAVIFSLVVTESDSSKGLKFRVYSIRLADYMGVDESIVLSCLPNNRNHWKNYSNAPPEWSGYEGFFTSVEEANKFLRGLAEVQKDVGKDAQN